MSDSNSAQSRSGPSVNLGSQGQSAAPNVPSVDQSPPLIDSPSDASATDDRTVVSTEPPLGPSSSFHGIPTAELARVLEGRRLGEFRLLNLIAGGGMGVVFRGIDEELNRPVAVKVISADQHADEDTRRRFKNEAQSAARLDHENIARVYKFGEDDGLQYIVFEYIEGTNIRDLVQQNGRLSLGDAIRITLQVSEALAHASQRDVVHRDIKPSNILITEQGRAKLVDLGLARLQQVDPAAPDLTSSGVTLGTFDYISPEQARDPRSADVRSDIYSLGCTLYFMLAGQPLFPKGTVLQKLLRHQGDEAPDLLEVRPELPEEISLLLAKMLAKSPDDRYQEPEALIADLVVLANRFGLSSATSGATVWVATDDEPESFFKKNVPWIAPTVLLVASVVALEFLWSPGHGRDASTGVDHLVTTPSLDPIDANPLPSVGTDGLPTERPADSEEESPGSSRGPRPRDENLVQNHDPPRPPHNARSGDPGGRDSDRPSGSRSDRETPRRNRNLGAPDLPDQASSASARLRPDRFTTEWSSADPSTGQSWASAELLARNESSRLDVAGGASPRAGPEEPQSPPPLPSSVPLERRDDFVVAPERAGSDERTFTSLRAAAHAARTGDVIELRFDGAREQEPFKLVNKRLTIRGGKDYSPLIVFRPEAGTADRVAHERSMITVMGGDLALINVRFQLDVPRDVAVESLSLFESRGADSVRLDRCWLTVQNHGQFEGVSFFDVTEAPDGEGLNREDSSFEDSSFVDESVEFQLENCIARGAATLLHCDEMQPVSLSWKNGLFVTTERLLETYSGGMLSRPQGKVQLDLQNLTAFMRRGLIQAVQSDDAQLIPITVECRDSILMTDEDAVLIELRSNDDPDRVRNSITWHGDRNFYEKIRVFWVMRDATFDSSEEMDFEAWQDYWGTVGHGHENRPHYGEVRWARLPDLSQDLGGHLPSDYELEDRTSFNPARGGAGDGEDVGFRTDMWPAPTRSGGSAEPDSPRDRHD